MTNTHNPHELPIARRYLAIREQAYQDNMSAAFDLVDDALTRYPDQADFFLAVAHELSLGMADKSRYAQYQQRFFDFGIKPGDKVLDIGSGHIPFPMATVLADVALTDDKVGRAGTPFKYVDGKPVYECSVESTPFDDQAFDFVYCSHVLEHVADPEKACRELMRIGKRGYIETPSRGKDAMFSTAKLSNHRWAIELFNGVLVFTEYSARDVEGLNSHILLNMVCAPQTMREQAVAALDLISAPQLNTMLLWEGTFSFEIRRLNSAPVTITAASPPRLPAEPALRCPDEEAAYIYQSARERLEGKRMFAPIVMFAFNRPEHLRRTLEALAANILAIESDVFIYCDGPRNEEESPKTEAARKIADAAVGFKSVTVFKREKNFGLAANIIDGVTSIVARYGRTIVLEDDLVTSPHFLRYMNEGLELYADDPMVASIHGWCFPHEEQAPPKTFFLRGADCWGWGTWGRAWNVFQPDANVLLKEIRNRKLGYTFNINGTYDYVGMLERVAQGKNDSWAVRWLASAFLAGMYTLYSSVSLVTHIGGDGSGTNTGVNDIFDVPLSTAPIVLEKQPVEENRQMHESFQRFNRKLSLIPPAEGWWRRAKRCFVPPLKALLKDCLPPVAVRGLKKYAQRMKTATYSIHGKASVSAMNNVWQEGYPDWQSACAASEGYDSEAIFIKVRDASRMVRDGKAVYERDSVLFDHIEYSWPLLAGLMWLAARNNGKLRLIDFGGSLGSTYRQNRRFFQDLVEIRWNVVEQKHFVQCGREEFQTETLRFYDSIADCLATEKVDGILFSSVLQYIEEPYALLKQVCEYGFDYIIIDRTPFSNGKDSITVQHVPESIYNASYPCHFLDRKYSESILENNYMIQEWFDDTLGGHGWHGVIAWKE